MNATTGHRFNIGQYWTTNKQYLSETRNFMKPISGILVAI